MTHHSLGGESGQAIEPDGNGGRLDDRRRSATVHAEVRWLIASASALLLVAGFIFNLSVKSQLDSLRLELARAYATKSESMSAREYDIRHAELERQIALLSVRVNELDREIVTFREMLTKHTAVDEVRFNKSGR